MKSENRFLTAVRAGLSDSVSEFGSCRVHTLVGHFRCFSFHDLTSSVSSVTSRTSEDSSCGFQPSSPAECHLRGGLKWRRSWEQDRNKFAEQVLDASCKGIGHCSERCSSIFSLLLSVPLTREKCHVSSPYSLGLSIPGKEWRKNSEIQRYL